MTTVLVTGASGNVGSRVVEGLRRRGLPVRAFVRDPARVPAGPGVEVFAGDFGTPESVRAAMEGADALFLSCSNQPLQADYEMRVVDAAAAAGVRQVVKLSALGAAAGSPLAFWDGHGRVEEHLASSGLAAAVLRPTFYMSGLLAAADTVRQLGRLFLPAGGARVAMVDPRDVADGAVALLAGEAEWGAPAVLTGPDALTFADAAAALGAATGRTVEFVDVPDEAAHGSMLQAGMPPWLADNLIVLFGLLRQGVAASVSDGVRSLTGREPRSFAAFARDHAAAFAPAGGEVSAAG